MFSISATTELLNSHHCTKTLKIFNGFIGFCLTEHQIIVHVILTAQKISMPLT